MSEALDDQTDRVVLCLTQGQLDQIVEGLTKLMYSEDRQQKVIRMGKLEGLKMAIDWIEENSGR